MLEYRWGVHILLKSADDIRQLDRNLQSLYSFSSLRKEFPTLPTLRAPRPGKNESVDGYVVAEDLRQYFQVLLRLDGSAFCADLLSLQCLSFFIPSFLEIPVKLFCTISGSLRLGVFVNKQETERGRSRKSWTFEVSTEKNEDSLESRES